MPTIERSTPSIYLQAKQLVWKAVVGLALDGLNEKEIVIRDGPWNRTTVFRGISVWGNKVADGPHSSNYRNHSGYAVVLSMLRKEEGSPGTSGVNDRFPLWKTSIKRRLHHQQLRGLSFPGATHTACTVQDSSLAVPAKHPDGGAKWQGDQLIVWFWVREEKDNGE